MVVEEEVEDMVEEEEEVVAVAIFRTKDIGLAVFFRSDKQGNHTNFVNSWRRFCH